MLANNSNYSNYNEIYTNDDDDVRMLFRAWINERESPTLLDSQFEILENVLELLANQQAILEEVDEVSVENDYINCLYEMEMERIRYISGSYIRCRLDKIENIWMIDDHLILNRMTKEEKEYFNSFKRIKRAALAKWSNNDSLSLSYKGIQDFKEHEGGKHLIFRVIKDDLGDLQIDPTSLTRVELLRNDIYVVRASIALPLLQRGDVELV